MGLVGQTKSAKYAPTLSLGQYFFPLCTPQTCGQPDAIDPKNEAKGMRIDLRSSDLRDADLRYAQLFGANLSGAKLTGASLDNINWDEAAIWPAGFTPPPSRP
jgi:hypothetical protein